MATDFEWTRDQFVPLDGIIYLDGNSLGLLPKSAAHRVTTTVQDEWGKLAITGWNRAGWMAQPRSLGDRIARLIGAEPGHVVVGDTLSIKVFQALAAASKLTDRKVILSDTGNFPSDLYMAEGLISLLDGYELRTVTPDQVAASITPDVGILMLTEVDYRTGRRHDMSALTKTAQANGTLTVWDLAHSAGATDVDVSRVGADFAVGCTYKFLNAGPGAPAFIYVNPKHAATAHPALSGWLGHKDPFSFDPTYRAGDGIDRMRVGTPPVLQNAALDAALDIWDQVDMADVRRACMTLSDHFIQQVMAQTDKLSLASPADAGDRGSQVSFHFKDGYAAMQAVIDRGVIGDFRAPDIMRFGITPLYIGTDDLTAAAKVIADVVNNDLWTEPQYQVRQAVT
ncbi:MAG: kynureninase [Pseudomonadota bacterium]